MEKEDAWGTTASFGELDLNPRLPSKSEKSTWISSSSMFKTKRRTAPRLVSLCIGVLGRHLEDIIDSLPIFCPILPSNAKMAIAAIARRRNLLNDDVIVALAESSWQILDLSGSDVSDRSLSQLAKTCISLKAVDISRCSKLTPNGIADLLTNSRSLEVLRWGGCPASERSACRCARILKPSLHSIAGDSWEDLEIPVAAQSLRWLVWPSIGKDSMEFLSAECPRIIVNPKPSPFGFRGLEVPREALPNVVLDDQFLEDIDPKTWAMPVSGIATRLRAKPTNVYDELPVAEKFRLAFLERDNRLAPKRAKNARQHQRRAERERVSMDSTAKSMVLASVPTKSLRQRR